MGMRLGWVAGVMLMAGMARGQAPCTPEPMIRPGRIGGMASRSPSEGSAVPVDPPNYLPPVVRGRPYTLLKRETMTFRLETGEVTPAFTETREMRDSEGRTRVETGDMSCGELRTLSVSVIDPVARTGTSWSAFSRVANVSRYVERPPPPKVDPARVAAERARQERFLKTHPNAGPVVRVSTLDPKTVDGVYAEGRRRTVWSGTRLTEAIGELRVGDPDLEVTDSWLSQELQIEIASGRDNMSSVSKMEVVKIDRREPDASLFRAPPGYTVVEEK
jgi:hypothetical protein